MCGVKSSTCTIRADVANSGLGYIEDYRAYFVPRVLLSSLIGGFYQVGQVVECLSIFSKARLIFVNNLVFIEETV